MNLFRRVPAQIPATPCHMTALQAVSNAVRHLQRDLTLESNELYQAQEDVIHGYLPGNRVRIIRGTTSKGATGIVLGTVTKNRHPGHRVLSLRLDTGVQIKTYAHNLQHCASPLEIQALLGAAELTPWMQHQRAVVNELSVRLGEVTAELARLQAGGQATLDVSKLTLGMRGRGSYDRVVEESLK